MDSNHNNEKKLRNELGLSPTTPKSPKSNNDENLMRFSKMGFGLELVGLVTLFGYAGYWADQKWHHDFPWLMLVLGAIAFIGVFVQFFKDIGRWWN